MSQLSLDVSGGAPKHNILVGTASWTDKSLVQSGWYPKGVNSAEDRLRFYAEQFPIVETDSTYYFLPTLRNATLWAERTPRDFTFNVKAFSLLTGHPTELRAIPEQFRPVDAKNPSGANNKVYADALTPKHIEAIWDDFNASLAPLRDARKLGFVLLQFPPWFTCTKENMNDILNRVHRLSMPACIEFRHHSWLNEDNAKETLRFLEKHQLPYVIVDMPQGFKSSVPPVIAATADTAVVRFHGRNAADWESGSVQKRFAYKYSTDELTPWSSKIIELSDSLSETHVLMNNCHKDFAQTNATQLIEMIEDQLA